MSHQSVIKLTQNVPQNTHPGHELNKDGEFSLVEVPKAAVVLNNPLVTQILQQLNLTLQSVHFLQRDREGKKKGN